ncbi:hypothetical protein BR63_00245 [Thermanaerosceptrum fracticalcis]|uniref:DUF4878 domain-containing protein n=2 Tax=Thermanaerosceptrum fracticalcis TaxID=1712410 RepID=A0A7G6DYJ0_THEFR|nr:hypothetical protein BR63_00245 [Thermanaerosceptrum fracticalcis]
MMQGFKLTMSAIKMINKYLLSVILILISIIVFFNVPFNILKHVDNNNITDNKPPLNEPHYDNMNLKLVVPTVPSEVFMSPESVMKSYLEAEKKRDWLMTYALLQVPQDISIEQYCKEMNEYNGQLLDYKIEGVKIIESKDMAVVYVTYNYTVGDKKFLEIKEPFSCIKIDGLWKVRWLPRQ